MSINTEAYKQILQQIKAPQVQLIAVSKIKPIEDIMALYKLGQRDFGENYVQELVDKQASLPKDIRWHFIGHLQTNKVKYIAPFVHLIQGVDSLKLLQEINKQGLKNNRVINCLLQIHIAQEETKFGLNEAELNDIKAQIQTLPNVRIGGFMGMASFTDDQEKLKAEFEQLKSILEKHQSELLPPSTVNGLPSTVHRPPSTVLSMGMSSDYQLAIECGSNMVRIGSLLFGARK